MGNSFRLINPSLKDTIQMIRSASQMRAAARMALSGKWGGAVILTLVYMLIIGAVPMTVNYCLFNGSSSIVQLLLLPLGYSFAVAFLENGRNGSEYKVNQLFEGFYDYKRIFLTLILVGVYIFLWMLLFVVPGIIKSYSYSMTNYILKDNPDLKYNDAIERSMAMMKGHKFDLFYLQLTFIGWGLLCLLTGGIGFLWLSPYMASAMANFYEDVKAEFEEKNNCVQEI